MGVTLEITGRRVLVTGAGQGVGRAVALGCARAGAEVVVNDLDPDRAEQVVAEIHELGAAASTSAFDVTDHDAVQRSIASLGGVDVLVNNAGNAGAEGFGPRGTFAESDPADWEPFLQVNLYGTLHCSRAVLPGMIERRWGRLVTIVSDAGRTGDAGGAVYRRGQAGAAGLTRGRSRSRTAATASRPTTSHSARCTRPRPTPFWADPRSEMATAILRDYVIRRPGQPDEVASLVVYLSSEHGQWITGQTYPLNGGYSFAL